MHGHGGDGRGGLRSEINVTPLVDVCLVLLIIFMVVTPLLQAGYAVATPPAGPGGQTRAVVVRLDRDGNAYLNHDQVSRTELESRLSAMDLTHRSVLFAADGELPYGEVADFMDLCRHSGAKNLGIVFDDLAPAGS